MNGETIRCGNGFLTHITAGDKSWKLHSFVFYPQDKHAAIFKDASDEYGKRHVRPGGPAALFPGAVGVVRAAHHLHMRRVEVDTAQACFKINPEGVSSTLAKKYGGWRTHCFNALFEHCKENGVDRVVFRDESKSSRASIDFRKAALRHGFKHAGEQFYHNPVTGGSIVYTTMRRAGRLRGGGLE